MTKTISADDVDRLVDALSRLAKALLDDERDRDFLDAHQIAKRLHITPQAVRRIDDLRDLWFTIPGRRGAVITREQYQDIKAKWRDENLVV